MFAGGADEEIAVLDQFISTTDETRAILRPAEATRSPLHALQVAGTAVYLLSVDGTREWLDGERKGVMIHAAEGDGRDVLGLLDDHRGAEGGDVEVCYRVT